MSKQEKPSNEHHEAHGRIRELLSEKGKALSPRLDMSGVDIGTTPPSYGLNLTEIKALAKQFKKNNALSKSLYDAETAEEQLLGIYLAEPKKLSADEIRAMAGKAGNWNMSDKLAREIVAAGPHAHTLIREWLRHEDPYHRRMAWLGVFYFGRDKKTTITDAEMEEMLALIMSTLQEEHNWVREAMNYALFTIGSRPALKEKALSVFDATGKVEIDYGHTGCQTMDVQARLRAL